MSVQHDLGALVALVDAAMDEEGAVLERVPALDDVAVEISHHQIVGGDLRPLQSHRICQEPLLMAWHRHAEMVAHAFIEAMAGGAPERRCEIEARLGYRVVGQHQGNSAWQGHCGQ